MQPCPPFKSCRFGKICRTGQPFQCLQYCLYLHHGPSSSVFKVTFDGKGDGLTTSFTWNGTPVGKTEINPSMLLEVQTNVKYFIETDWWRICGNFALSWTRSIHDMSFDKVMFFYMVLFLVWARSEPNVWICVNKAVLWFASTSWKIFVSLNVGAKKILLSYFSFSFSLLFLHPFCSTLHSL